MAARTMKRLFTERRRDGRAALVGYLVAGDPDLETSWRVVEAAAAAGLDLLELGVPYSDPLADGPTIAAAGQRALGAGTTLNAVLELARRTARLLPVVLFSYLNPVLRFGVERFAEEAAAAGVAGVIIPDVTLEELEGIRDQLWRRNLAMPLLVAPTTSAERAGRIAAASRGFVYVVSRMGVTGERSGPDVSWLRARVGELRQATSKPLAVGFGISRPEQVAAVSDWCDGVIVGSALVASYEGARGEDAARLAAGFVRSLSAARRIPETR